MANVQIEANYRSDMSKSRMKKIRREGFVTGSIFGHNFKPVPVEVNLNDLVAKLKNSEMGLKSLIDVKVVGAPENSDGTVVIKNFFKDPLTKKVLDIQFQRVSMEEKINIGVPIEFVGTAPGEKEGGILEHTIDELEVTCLPKDIPASIQIDVSKLGIGDHIFASDVPLPPGVDLHTDPDTVVVTCVAPHVHKAEAEEAEAESSSQAE